eukprot:CAMPEP_0179444688 /NCGR_PEP_ID=MMETSP0799-20121207/28117_1 /TAXON_ID=46947 /ORGANISM="Geminigera cryophila, Strain CCMP2564" /LENGTH=69 /DNA_ID=CAMNT_0021231947 /DNA_START=18 /DNA_END=224 /DNA_ORIENTATION=-
MAARSAPFCGDLFARAFFISYRTFGNCSECCMLSQAESIAPFKIVHACECCCSWRLCGQRLHYSFLHVL